MKRAIYPGSFDPITIGHVDIIERAALLCDTLMVVVMKNVHKKSAFSVEERMELIRTACAHIPNVRVSAFEGMLVDCARAFGAQAVVRGLRSTADFEYELQMAQLNRRLYPACETLFMMAAPEHACVSSSAVREIAAFGGDMGSLLPASIAQAVGARLGVQKNSEHL